MRRLPYFVLGAAILASIAPAQAQLYDPRYPVCMQVFGDLEGERMDCIFSSIPQCKASASGRAAMCLVNPFFHPDEPVRRRPRGRADM